MASKKIVLPGEPKLKNAKHELFSVLYAGVASGYYFGNGTRCYLHAFGREKEIEDLQEQIEKTYEMPGKTGDNKRRTLKSRIKSIENSARSYGAQLLANISVANRTNYLLDRYLSDDYADREMAFVISQRDDLMAKVAAYREGAKVKERVRGANALSGEFTFTWDKDETGAKKQVVKSVKVKATNDDDGMVAAFA